MTPATRLSDTEVVRVLWYKEAPEWAMTENNVPDYLQSKDALAPVLAKLSDAEWKFLHDSIWGPWWDLNHGPESITIRARSCVAYILTLPPEKLAEAVAEAIVNAKAAAAK